ncbi:MAG TPA: ferrous iron transport protein B [Lentisphaeria bacterium]|nr:MAG: ferrous iron transport protein B [Lentisphaerae bacterium GWF2_50_93]HCE45939.1 ferrous iron transport protein B [Lentisphaeria bacterium]
MNSDAGKKILIAGNPNVGKSVIFNDLTGSYATVSNYPGTSVEVSRGKGKIGSDEYDIIDTPGMYSLIPITEEERVSQKIILTEKADVLIHVIDAKNLERMLPFTFQLLEAGLPVILVLNIMDEAEKLGMKIDIPRLESELKIPVIPTVSVTGRGMDLLRGVIINYSADKDKFFLRYDKVIEEKIATMEALSKTEYMISKRAAAILLLQKDTGISALAKKKEPDFEKMASLADETAEASLHSVNYMLNMKRYQAAADIEEKVLSHAREEKVGFAETLSRLMMNPLTGIPILMVVLYFGFYKFIGGFGAGVLVDFLENTVFTGYVNPYVTKIVEGIVPWVSIQQLFVGEYGIITLGIRYAVAIILPIVGTFFIVFAVIEDTGYLPRLAMLIDRVFKQIGLSGRAVIPMVLGLGCKTMATMVTRTLSTNRERIMATLLLALAVPCAAQLGVILTLFKDNLSGFLIWAAIIFMIFLLVGFIGAKILPGEKPVFFMEVPPLRLPKLSNIIVKTYTRMVWYFVEVLPLFILASVLIWIGQITGVFDLLVGALVHPVRLLDLPDRTAVAFFFGFFRRDYGAAGLYELNTHGLLNGNQLLVASVVMTVFLPCIAQLIMNIKERGWKTGVGISVFILFFSFGSGLVLSAILKVTGVHL